MGIDMSKMTKSERRKSLAHYSKKIGRPLKNIVSAAKLLYDTTDYRVFDERQRLANEEQIRNGDVPTHPLFGSQQAFLDGVYDHLNYIRKSDIIEEAERKTVKRQEKYLNKTVHAAEIAEQRRLARNEKKREQYRKQKEDYEKSLERAKQRALEEARQKALKAKQPPINKVQKPSVPKVVATNQPVAQKVIAAEKKPRKPRLTAEKAQQIFVQMEAQRAEEKRKNIEKRKMQIQKKKIITEFPFSTILENADRMKKREKLTPQQRRERYQLIISQRVTEPTVERVKRGLNGMFTQERYDVTGFDFQPDDLQQFLRRRYIEILRTKPADKNMKILLSIGYLMAPSDSGSGGREKTRKGMKFPREYNQPWMLKDEEMDEFSRKTNMESDMKRVNTDYRIKKQAAIDAGKNKAWFNPGSKTFITSPKIADQEVQRKMEEFLVRIGHARIEDGEFSRVNLKVKSGMVFDCIVEFVIKYVFEQQARVGSFIETPKYIANKKCTLNVKNEDDDKCFIWSILASRHRDEVGKDANKYLPKGYKKWEKEIIEPEGQTYPIDVFNDVAKFERLNKFKINVYELDVEVKENETEERPVLIYNSGKNYDVTEIINLLLIQKQQPDGSIKQHFVWITNFSAFMRTEANTKGKRHYCLQCLQANYDTEEKLQQHIEVCKNFGAVRCVLPKPNEAKDENGEEVTVQSRETTLKFVNEGKTFDHPFFIAADFESTLVPMVEESIGGTRKVSKHIPNSFGVYFSCIHTEYSKPIIIVNSPDPEDLMRQFVEVLEDLTRYAIGLLERKRIVDFNEAMTKREKWLHFNKETCTYCNCVLTDKPKGGEAPVDKIKPERTRRTMHHDHISGKYIATCCNACNLKRQYRKFVPVVIHNIKNYDGHFIIPALSKYGTAPEGMDDYVSCIASNSERYISFSKKIKFFTEPPLLEDGTEDKKKFNPTCEIRFLDSFAFMASSLDNLGTNCARGADTVEKKRAAFPALSAHFQDDMQFEMMMSKGIYPYEYITDYSVFSNCQLPPREKFYSHLTREECTKDDYRQAEKVWLALNCKNLLDYHNLYLKTDVLLLADVWHNFVKVSKKMYGLDPNYYYTSPGLSWDAMLKHSCETFPGFEIHLLTDMDMYQMFEGAVRGGLSQISTRYAKANNKYINPDFRPGVDEESHIIYLDANNLYGCGMMSYLPYQDFEWNHEEWTPEKIMAIKSDAEVGYLFEVDIQIPESRKEELHNLFNGYPILPENIAVKNDELHENQIRGIKRTENDDGSFTYHDRTNPTIKKLVCSLHPKKKYSLNYRYLQLAIELGYEITAVHRVIQFTQLNFMASYIMKNTIERSKPGISDFEKDFFKLMNNSVYGKTMENVRNRINFRLLTTEEAAKRVKNQINDFVIFNESCVGVHLLKREVKLNKPIFIGQTVLDESKIIMGGFHYKFMLKNFKREDIKLCFTDTDSLAYYIKNTDPYEVIARNKEYFDLSEYPKDHPMYDATNCKALAAFKDEAISKMKLNFITEFVGLRSKMYAYKKYYGGHEELKAKGVKKCVKDKDLTFEKYNQVRMHNSVAYAEEHGMVRQQTFRSHLHQIYTEEVHKCALSSFDDKVFICPNQIDTLSFGHYKIEEYKRTGEVTPVTSAAANIEYQIPIIRPITAASYLKSVKQEETTTAQAPAVEKVKPTARPKPAAVEVSGEPDPDCMTEAKPTVFPKFYDPETGLIDRMYDPYVLQREYEIWMFNKQNETEKLNRRPTRRMPDELLEPVECKAIPNYTHQEIFNALNGYTKKTGDYSMKPRSNRNPNEMWNLVDDFKEIFDKKCVEYKQKQQKP